jgi:hypothetical protein
VQNIHLYAMRTFYSPDAGRLVTLENDVLSVVSQVRELTDGRVSVQLDPETGWYHLIEHCEDTTDRLVFSVEALDGRVIRRLQRADSQSNLHEDPYDAVEREQDELHARREEQARDRIREAGERLQVALRKAGEMPRMPHPVAIPKDVNADQ